MSCSALRARRGGDPGMSLAFLECGWVCGFVVALGFSWQARVDFGV